MSPWVSVERLAAGLGPQPRRASPSDASMPWTSTPRAASGRASRPEPTPELEHGTAAACRDQRGEPVGAGVDVGDVAVPVVVDVGEAVAVGARLVALHRPSVAGRDRRARPAGPVERGRGLGRPRRSPPTAPRPPPARRGAGRRRPSPPTAGLPASAPMTMSDILDGGFAILKRAPATVIGLTAVFVIPIQALGAWLNRGAEGLDLGRGARARATRRSSSATPAATSGAARFVLQVGPMLALVFVAAAHRPARVGLVRRARPDARASSCGARCRDRVAAARRLRARAPARGGRRSSASASSRSP